MWSSSAILPGPSKSIQLSNHSRGAQLRTKGAFTTVQSHESATPPHCPLKAPFYQYLLTYSDILSLSLQALPYFFIFIFLESIIRWLQRKPLPRLNDSINSISAGAIEQLGILVTGTVGVASYAWVYEHWRIADLPWDSALTWWLAFLGVDCGYYWFHRMAHG